VHLFLRIECARKGSQKSDATQYRRAFCVKESRYFVRRVIPTGPAAQKITAMQQARVAFVSS